MRVIAGEKRHLLLKTVPGLDVRPTQDRTKETLFNVMNPYIAGSNFLDLFSGSGAIGIEALSRGAKSAVLVDINKASLDCIKDNLKSTGLIDRARVLATDAVSAVNMLEGEGKVYDFIFMDPPYNKELERQVLERLAFSKLVDENTWIIVEASDKTDLSYCPSLGFEIFKEKNYKTNKHVFIKKLSLEEG